jgi:hypothetical protein
LDLGGVKGAVPQDVLRNMPRKHSKKILNRNSRFAANQKMQMIPRNRPSIDANTKTPRRPLNHFIDHAAKIEKRPRILGIIRL